MLWSTMARDIAAWRDIESMPRTDFSTITAYLTDLQGLLL